MTAKARRRAWDQKQRDSRRARVERCKRRVRAKIMAANGMPGQAPRCMDESGCARTRHLVVDHPDGRTWNVRRPNEEVRWSTYERELDGDPERGVPPIRLRLLCQEHSGRHGQRNFQGRPRWRGGSFYTAEELAARPASPRATTAQEDAALEEYLLGPRWLWEDSAQAAEAFEDEEAPDGGRAPP